MKWAGMSLGVIAFGMSMDTHLRSVLLRGIAPAVAVVASAFLLGQAVVRVARIKYSDETITVTGSAKQRIRSDLIVWRAAIASRGPELAIAYRKLTSDVPKTTDYLKRKGVPADKIVVKSVKTTEQHARDKEAHELPEQIIGYVLEQDIEVTSSDVDRITQIANDSTELINDGVQLTSEPPVYIYTGLADLKVKLLAEASHDARQRAEQIASNTGGSLGGIRSAKMGVMQINPAWDTSVSGAGNSDTSSLEKDVLAIVTASFASRCPQQTCTSAA